MKLIAKQDISQKRSYEYEIFLENTNNKIYHVKFNSRKDWIMKQLYISNSDNSLIYEIKQEDNTVPKIIFNFLKKISPIPADRCKFYIYKLGEKIGYILSTTKHGIHIEAVINGAKYEAWNLYNNYISVYENDKQIALIERERMNRYADIYYINCNDDVSKEVIIILNLITDIECFTFAHHKEPEYYKVIHIASPRKFDKNWIPNQDK